MNPSLLVKWKYTIDSEVGDRYSGERISSRAPPAGDARRNAPNCDRQGSAASLLGEVVCVYLLDFVTNRRSHTDVVVNHMSYQGVPIHQNNLAVNPRRKIKGFF